MGFFSLKKKEDKEQCCCCCKNKAVVSQSPLNESVKSIKVLGAGCKSCHEQYENVKEAVKNSGLAIEVEYITDMQKIMEYGVMSMPAIVVNEKVLTQGKVLKPSYIEKLFDTVE